VLILLHRKIPLNEYDLIILKIHKFKELPPEAAVYIQAFGTKRDEITGR
jgi:hypothetical protein